MFVADAWYGGGLAREMDSRAAEMRQRQVQRYTLTVDNLQLISTANDAFATEADFERTAFLATIDRNSEPKFRGALS
jgi:hypothetical protein